MTEEEGSVGLYDEAELGVYARSREGERDACMHACMPRRRRIIISRIQRALPAPYIRLLDVSFLLWGRCVADTLIPRPSLLFDWLFEWWLSVCLARWIGSREAVKSVSEYLR
jgi:hypothetical protein